MNNSLCFCDCLSLLERMPESSFTLAYLDPPWNTGSDFFHIEQNGNTPRREYFTFISNVFQQIRRVLNDRGTIFVHSNPSLETPFRLILEQVFEGRFVTEIILPGRVRHSSRIDKPVTNHFSFLVYSKTEDFISNPQYIPLSANEEAVYNRTDRQGRYRLSSLLQTGPRSTRQFTWRGYSLPEGKFWKFSEDILNELEREGRIFFSKKGTPPQLKVYIEEHQGKIVGSIWDDINPIPNQDERSDSQRIFTAQQSLKLLRRVISIGSNPGDWIIDPFLGSGTSVVAASTENRHWIGCDVEEQAIATTIDRLHGDGARESADYYYYDQLSTLQFPVVWRNYRDVITKLRSPQIKLVENEVVELEETKGCEFKEIKGGKPIDTIKNTVDEYVVAFLNGMSGAGIGGSIFWGITDKERRVCGVKLEYKAKDELLQTIGHKLGGIQPQIRSDGLWVEAHPVYETYESSKPKPDTYVIQVYVFPPEHNLEPYYTESGDCFVKTETGKKKLTGQALTQWIIENFAKNQIINE